jgi:hypothetical protein
MNAFRSYEAFRSNSDAHTKYNIQFVGAPGILLTPKSIQLSVHPSPHLYVGMKKTDSLEKLLSLLRELRIEILSRHSTKTDMCFSPQAFTEGQKLYACTEMLKVAHRNFVF